MEDDQKYLLMLVTFLSFEQQTSELFPGGEVSAFFSTVSKHLMKTDIHPGIEDIDFSVNAINEKTGGAFLPLWEARLGRYAEEFKLS